MKRPATLIVTVVLLVVGGLLCLGMAALMGWTMLLTPQGSTPGFERVPAAFKVLPSATFGVAALWMLATAIGIWKVRVWARLSLLVFSAVLVMMQAFGLLFLFVLMPLDVPSADSAMMAGVRGGIAAFYGVQIALGIWWLIYFNLKRTKELFTAGASPDPRALPLSIVVIAWHLVAGGAMCVLFTWLVWPAMVFGFVLKGWPAAAAYIAIGTVSLFIGLALLKRHARAVDWSLYYFGFWTVHAVVYWALTTPEKAMRDMSEFTRSLNLPDNGQAPFVAPVWVNVLLVLLMMAIPFWYLLTRKKAYLAACSAAQTESGTSQI